MSKIGIKNDNSFLPFDQPGDFYYRRAMKFAQKDEYEKAVFNIRKAIDKDSKNAEYMLDLAGLLTEIEHFDDSNDLIFAVLRKSKDQKAECYFGLGCNFYGLNDYKKASSSFSKYLSLSPKGEYAEDAEIMLENIDYDLHSENDDALGFEWQTALNEGNSKKAIEILSEFTDQSQIENVLIQNNLTIAYLLENKVSKALECCEKILFQEPNNIHALCNMSMIQSRLENNKQAKQYIWRAMAQTDYDISELLKISIALCDLDLHEDAAQIFYELLDENPYDLHSRHFLSIALYNYGEYEKALTNLKFISKFKPENSVNNWYIKIVNDRISEINDIDYLPYINQISSECVYERINKINDILKDKSIKKPWENDEFRELVLWAFDIKDDSLKASMISLIAKYAGNEAIGVLLSKLCSRFVSDEIKHRILINLKIMGAQEPYVALMEDSIVEINVNTFEVNNNKYLDYQKDIIELISFNLPKDYDSDYFAYIINIWNKIVANDELFDNITDCKLWAAALEYEYTISQKLDSAPSQISIKYNVDMQKMIDLKNKIKAVFEGIQNGNNDNRL